MLFVFASFTYNAPVCCGAARSAALSFELTCRPPAFHAITYLYEKPYSFPGQVQRFVLCCLSTTLSF
jgi:hypothetical protein